MLLGTVKLRFPTPPPFDPRVDPVDLRRKNVSCEVDIAAKQAWLRLRQRHQFNLLPFVVAGRWRYHSAIEFTPLSHKLYLRHPSIKVWPRTEGLHVFWTYVRPFALDADGQLWSWQYFRDWKYEQDVSLAFPLGNIIDCWYETDLLDCELLPTLRKLGTG